MADELCGCSQLWAQPSEWSEVEDLQVHQVRPHSDVPDEPESARPVLDVVRERRPPFSPEEVVNEFETSVYQGNLATVHRLD